MTNTEQDDKRLLVIIDPGPIRTYSDGYQYIPVLKRVLPNASETINVALLVSFDSVSGASDNSFMIRKFLRTFEDAGIPVVRDKVPERIIRCTPKGFPYVIKKGGISGVVVRGNPKRAAKMIMEATYAQWT